MAVAMQYANIVLLSFILAVATVCIHMYALFAMRRWVRRLLVHETFGQNVMRETVVVTAMVVGLCLVHLIEVLVWAVGFMSVGALSHLGNAVYFSLTNYTTVGPQGVSVNAEFRGVAGFESLLGPMMMAWSTAFLVEYVTRLAASETAPRGGGTTPG